MLKVDMAIHGLRNISRALKAEKSRQKRALATSARVEAFRLVKTLKAQIRSGTIAGKRLTPLTFLARRTKPGPTGSWKSTNLRPDRPLARFALGVAYDMKRRDPMDVRVGFTGPRSSKSWQRLSKSHQEGFEHGMSKGYREEFVRIGGQLGKRAAGRQHLFIRHDKTRFRTPARPIIEPFWAAERDNAARNIRRNFIRKLRGERI